MGWEIYPEGLAGSLLDPGYANYDVPPLYISENGAAFRDTARIDNARCTIPTVLHYIQHHLKGGRGI